MKIIELLTVSEDAAGVGRITRQNMTKDVGPNEVAKQAAKWGNKVTRDGRPPLLRPNTSNALNNLAKS